MTHNFCLFSGRNGLGTSVQSSSNKYFIRRLVMKSLCGGQNPVLAMKFYPAHFQLTRFCLRFYGWSLSYVRCVSKNRCTIYWVLLWMI